MARGGKCRDKCRRDLSDRPPTANQYVPTRHATVTGCFTSTETVRLIRISKLSVFTLIRDGGGGGGGVGNESLGPPPCSHNSWTLTLLCRGALRPQKPYGLLGTREEWDRQWDLGPPPCSHGYWTLTVLFRSPLKKEKEKEKKKKRFFLKIRQQFTIISFCEPNWPGWWYTSERGTKMKKTALLRKCFQTRGRRHTFVGGRWTYF